MQMHTTAFPSVLSQCWWLIQGYPASMKHAPTQTSSTRDNSRKRTYTHSCRVVPFESVL